MQSRYNYSLLLEPTDTLKQSSRTFTSQCKRKLRSEKRRLQAFTSSAGYLPRLGARSLNRRLGCDPWEINPFIFHSSGTCDCPLAQTGGPAGLSYFKCFSPMENSQNTPKIYVGTYGMYNSRSLFGK
jgi:hypothetical protein